VEKERGAGVKSLFCMLHIKITVEKNVFQWSIWLGCWDVGVARGCGKGGMAVRGGGDEK
jgi:hypothetical protein